MQGLDDKVIVFAGAGGIATATAGFLGQGGAKIVVSDISLASAEQTVRACTAAGGQGVATTADISDEAQVKALIDLALSTYGRIDGLFNVAANIGVEEVAADTNVVDIDLAAWQRTLDVNLTGYLLTCKHAIPHIIAAGGGAVVNTISNAVYAGMEVSVAYQATKAGISAMTRHIARKYGKDKIRANNISPGLVLTEQTKRNLPEDYREMILTTTPSWRHGEPADLGAMTAFLLSDLAAWVTGQTICVDGGTTMRA
ncbi:MULTISPECIES: SDR family NAD(P)-dependent oxidoreductase [unclassified Streptosporangium]|uniref:SDR family NAD(P)-dependent oxidoreductase n=1 Tax=Streptosporangium sp. NPDC005286 TaxID=3154463 RepID=UPI0033B2BF19